MLSLTKLRDRKYIAMFLYGKKQEKRYYCYNTMSNYDCIEYKYPYDEIVSRIDMEKYKKYLSMRKQFHDRSPANIDIQIKRINTNLN